MTTPPANRYGNDVLQSDWRAPARGRAVEVSADELAREADCLAETVNLP